MFMYRITRLLDRKIFIKGWCKLRTTLIKSGDVFREKEIGINGISFSVPFGIQFYDKGFHLINIKTNEKHIN